jgi:hypothetical protein
MMGFEHLWNRQESLFLFGIKQAFLPVPQIIINTNRTYDIVTIFYW